MPQHTSIPCFEELRAEQAGPAFFETSMPPVQTSVGKYKTEICVPFTVDTGCNHFVPICQLLQSLIQKEVLI